MTSAIIHCHGLIPGFVYCRGHTNFFKQNIINTCGMGIESVQSITDHLCQVY